MEKQLNIELRSRILIYSLFIEKIINDLVLLNLGIYDEKIKTRLFSNKGKISFQNKIDLLYDIEVLSKEENSEFDLLMIVRNKFMHDIECDSFQTLLNQLDKGIVNRFKKFLEEGQSISDEEACRKASYQLFQKNIETIKNKIELNKVTKNKKHELFQVQNERIIYYIDFIKDLMNKVSIATENSELENPKVAILGMELLQILEESNRKLNSETNPNIYEEFFNSDDNLKATFGVKGNLKDWPKWEDFKVPNITKSKIQ
ncbi:hypothetical protein ES677_06665 [Bizionia gelidisalsuginis]|uniref:DUF4145 domain-containing protein n=1 Tax=Bizionia gelidisalsuginis TaxID=291188 RepID=A0ABY3MBT0_9FLAO|nr:hypothetical protein [Bizionia gelidisalsuginis]TYC14216.1 hypothetical protein ES677_06665 [Bizionia gelidisalsuginis]